MGSGSSLRVAVIPADETGCGYFRLIWPAEVVQAARPDWKISVYRPGSVQISSTSDGIVKAVRGLDPTDVDLIVIQRVGLRGPVRFLEWAQARGVAVVVDADDAMWCIDRANSAWPAWNQPNGMHWRWLDRATAVADGVTVTTPYLARRYGKHGRVTVLPNRVPDGVTDIASCRGHYGPEPALGWMGFTGTHPGDLRVVGDAVRRCLTDEHGVARVIGDGAGAAREWGVNPDQVTQLGPYKLGLELYRGLTALDVALVPLADSRFNSGKSALKALEFSAVGVPVVASPTPANRALADDLPILLARTPDGWYKLSDRLLRSPDERRERGEQARRIIGDRMTMSGSAENWARAWQSAVDRRAAVSRRAGLAAAR